MALQAFKMTLVITVTDRQRRRRLPDHLPGRPVARLRRWAARFDRPRFVERIRATVTDAHARGRASRTATA